MALVEIFITSVGSSLLTAGVGWFLFQKWFEYRLGQSLETHKNQLATTTEHLKYEFQKDYLNAQHRSASVHSVYPELYEKLVGAAGAVKGLMSLQYGPDWEALTIEEIQHHLTAMEIPEVHKKKYLEEIQNSRSAGAALLRRYLDSVDMAKARDACRLAKNFQLLKSIYLSQEVKGTSTKILDALGKMTLGLRIDSTGPVAAKLLEEALIQEPIIQEHLTILEALMRRELSPSVVMDGP